VRKAAAYLGLISKALHKQLRINSRLLSVSLIYLSVFIFNISTVSLTAFFCYVGGLRPRLACLWSLVEAYLLITFFGDSPLMIDSFLSSKVVEPFFSDI
jgi:hypothetical protein